MTSLSDSFEIRTILSEMGVVGQRLSDLGASEGGAGNLSVLLGPGTLPPVPFTVEQSLELPWPVPELAGCRLLVTGSGVRFRELSNEPERQVGCLVIHPGGTQGVLFSAPGASFLRLTSELNSHLGIHERKGGVGPSGISVVLHAQPHHLTFLSHIPEYQEASILNRRLLRWQAEMAIQFPSGLGMVPFRVPGSAELVRLTLWAFEGCRAVLWQKHGIVSYSNRSLAEALDAIEYVEAAARYETLDLMTGRLATGLTEEEIRATRVAFKVT